MEDDLEQGTAKSSKANYLGEYQLPFGKGNPQATHRPTEIQGDLLEDFAQEVWEIRVLLSPYLGTYPHYFSLFLSSQKISKEKLGKIRVWPHPLMKKSISHTSQFIISQL